MGPSSLPVVALRARAPLTVSYCVSECRAIAGGGRLTQENYHGLDRRCVPCRCVYFAADRQHRGGSHSERRCHGFGLTARVPGPLITVPAIFQMTREDWVNLGENVVIVLVAVIAYGVTVMVLT